MSELIRCVVAGGVVAICLLVLLLIRALILSNVNWLDHRSCERAKRLERELAKTKDVLALVSQAQATMLDVRAHEAAVAMILESYRASKEAHDDPSLIGVVAKNTTTSGGSRSH